MDVVIRSKLVYGLEVVQIPDALKKKLDAFQLKGLRKILGYVTTFVDRANTNKKIFEDVNAIANPDGLPGKNVKSFSEYVSIRRCNYVKHIIREDDECPSRQVSFEPRSAVPYIMTNRRPGRPRGRWAEESLKQMYAQHGYGSLQQFKLNPARCCNQMYRDIVNKVI